MDELSGLGYGKKPFYKRIWFWILIIILIILFAFSLMYSDMIAIKNNTTIQEQKTIVKGSTQIIQGMGFEGEVDNSQAKETTLNAGKYQVGKDIPQGMYLAETTTSGVINVYNKDGEQIQESKVEEKGINTPIKSILVLKNGETLEITGMKNVKFTPYKTDYKTVLDQGIWQVGSDIEQGTYMFEIPNGNGMISINNSLGFNVFSEILNNQGSQSIKITLVNGDVVVINGISGIKLINLDKQTTNDNTQKQTTN